MPRQKKPVDEVARSHFSEIVCMEKERGVSQREMAERLSEYMGVTIPQQYISAYTKGREIPRDLAEAIESVFGYRAAWLYGYDNTMTVLEEAAMRFTERRSAKDARETWFRLTAQLAGWDVEYVDMAATYNVAAPFTGAGDAYDDTDNAKHQLDNYARIAKEGRHITLDAVAFDALIDKQLAAFDLDCTYLPRLRAKED
jgi:hypothetical protein